MKKTYEQLEQELAELTDRFAQFETQSEQVYSQIANLLLWKSSLKIKVNEACPYKEIVGKEGYISDLFPDGFTIWHIKEDSTHDFWRLSAEWLDIIEWDTAHFESVLKQLGYNKQEKGIWVR